MLQDHLGMEDDFGKMLQKFNRENICPGGTHKQFIPPIFLKMNWHGKQERQALVGIMMRQRSYHRISAGCRACLLHEVYGRCHLYDRTG